MTSLGDIRDSLAVLFLSIEGMKAELTNFANPKVPIDPNDLPGFFIHRATRGEHNFPAAASIGTTRTFLVVVLVTEIPPLDPVGKEAAYESAEDFIDNIPLLLAQNRALLDADGRALPGVAGITRLIDDIPEEMQRDTKKSYLAIPYRISVMYNSTL